MLLSPLSHLHLFSRGHSQRAHNVLIRQEGDAQVAVFDYRYTVGHGKNSQRYKQTVIHFRSDKLNLPCFNLRPESIFHKIGSVFGYQDIDFDNELEKFELYWTEGGRKLKRPKLALKNWMDKAREYKKRGSGYGKLGTSVRPVRRAHEFSEPV